MKKKKILLFLLSIIFSANAQKELWGVNAGSQYAFNTNYYGNITKTDLNGENASVMHEFDSINGYRPNGRLFLASNGKLYGTTALGGNRLQIGFDLYATIGVVFEYNLILNKYRVVKYFDWNETLPNGELAGGGPPIGVLEPQIGQLYGATANRVFKYDMITEIVSFYNKLPFTNQFSNELMKASDGNLYGTSYYLSCPNNAATQYENGCVVKFNMATNTLSVAHPLNCDIVSEGFWPSSQLVEISPGRLIGTTLNGGLDPVTIYARGTLFEYNYITDIFTKKKDFNSETGIIPFSLINVGNGKMYGLCQEGGTPQACNPENNFGTLFEYTHDTNTLEIKKYFNECRDLVRYPKSLVKTSAGHFVGSSYNIGYFQYNSVNNTIISNANDPLTPPNAQINDNFIEICRKPSYQEILVNTYTPEVSSTFTYNINNNNATTYIWKKGTTILPLQTTGILNLTNVTTNDTGVYTCTMTNECGTTITANLTINVSNLGADTIDNYKQQITLYPNPTKGSINLKFPENRGLKGLKFKITNLLGQVIQEKNIGNLQNKTEIPIDTAGFAKGVYQLTLITDKGDWNGKFVKE